jgi:hypothetical protein
VTFGDLARRTALRSRNPSLGLCVFVMQILLLTFFLMYLLAQKVSEYGYWLIEQ